MRPVRSLTPLVLVFISLQSAAFPAQSGSATVQGTIPVTANATDNVGVVGVQFFVDGAPLGAEDRTPPYSVTWNTTTVSNGTHTLTARARDAAGNIGTSPSVLVDVLNSDTIAPTVVITSPAP
jgi:Bacterial Ig domain